jgi:hypothetical protein
VVRNAKQHPRPQGGSQDGSIEVVERSYLFIPMDNFVVLPLPRQREFRSAMVEMGCFQVDDSRQLPLSVEQIPRNEIAVHHDEFAACKVQIIEAFT